MKTHLTLMHRDVFHPIDGTIKVNLEQISSARSFMHISKYLNQNRTDVVEQIQTVEQLEKDLKEMSNNDSLLELIRLRLDLMNKFLSLVRSSEKDS